jgi:deazaflavin-dependent oxidoreductase (nitroreductase family)
LTLPSSRRPTLRQCRGPRRGVARAAGDAVALIGPVDRENPRGAPILRRHIFCREPDLRELQFAEFTSQGRNRRPGIDSQPRWVKNQDGNVVHFPRFLRRVNRVFTNPILGMISWIVPPLATVHHVGRKTGRRYRTPVVAFRGGEGFVIPMTYGRDVDWAQNLRAAGGGELVRMGRRFELVRPRFVDGEQARAWLPPVVRSVLLAARLPGFVLADVRAGGGLSRKLSTSRQPDVR